MGKNKYKNHDVINYDIKYDILEKPLHKVIKVLQELEDTGVEDGYDKVFLTFDDDEGVPAVCVWGERDMSKAEIQRTKKEAALQKTEQDEYDKELYEDLKASFEKKHKHHHK